MIDDKKIEEAAREAADLYEQDLPIMSYNEDTEVDGQHHFCQEFGAELFKDGAKWAINEFLKDLWHDASEEPKMTNQENEFVECLVKFKDGIVYLYNYDTWHHWWCSDEDNQKFLGLIDKWLYIDDLLTKKKEVSND